MNNRAKMNDFILGERQKPPIHYRRAILNG